MGASSAVRPEFNEAGWPLSLRLEPLPVHVRRCPRRLP
jgi:hypothetical protein